MFAIIRNKDRTVLRELASRCAAIAALPVQEEKRRLWRKLNALTPERPMVLIDQICWEEIQADNSLVLVCDDAECRAYERALRRILYQWEHFPVDMVVEPFIRVPKAISNSGFGITLQENVIRAHESSSVASHRYHNQFQTLEDVAKIRPPVIAHDPAETERRLAFANWLFDGEIEIREEGYDPCYLSIWDPVSMWMGAESVLYAIADQPELLHAIAQKVADGYMSTLDQLESQGLLCQPQPLIHCTGAYVDELPSAGYNPARPRIKDLWMMGLAQLFAAVSPAVFETFEINYMLPLFERFGLVYYGCCDPLDGKMEQVRKIPNLRKISISPWANQAKGAEAIGPAYVLSRKPNPAYLALESFDAELIQREFMETLRLCRSNSCPVEFILKDISTVRGQPQRLEKWADIAMQAVCR